MKKTLLIIVIILAVILIVPVINLLRWSFEAKKPLDIIVVDKTVPNFDRLKHKSFNWVITNNRYVDKESKKSYSYKKDYYGFMPTRPEKSKFWDKNEYRLNDLIDIADSADALYFADTYGVFTNDWWYGSTISRRSRKLYGGLNNNDNLLIKEMKDRNKLVILESNTFEFPTVAFESQKTQDRLGISYSGWMGKYFSTLDTTSANFPIWMTAMYRKQYKQPWNFSKEGIIFVSEKNIIVLELGDELENPYPWIFTDPVYMEKWGITDSIPFDQWFEVISPLNNKTISTFRINTTDLGDSTLNKFGISSTFPAVIVEPINERTYYFSGDFTYVDIPGWSSIFKRFDWFNNFLYSKEVGDTRRFFWLYYVPLVEGVFGDYYDSLNQ